MQPAPDFGERLAGLRGFIGAAVDDLGERLLLAGGDGLGADVDLVAADGFEVAVDELALNLPSEIVGSRVHCLQLVLCREVDGDA